MLDTATNPFMWQRFLGRLFWRFILVVAAWGIGAGTTFFFKQDVLQWLMIPADGRLSPFPDGLPVFMQPTGALTATFGVASKGGLVTAVPVLIYSLYTLFARALPKKLRIGRVVASICLILLAFFLLGAAFAYYVVIPRMLDFLLGFGEGIAVPLISIEEYLGLLFNMVFWFGVIFQLPVAMFLLAKLDIMGYQQLRRIRRAVSIFAIILSIIITPTFDGFSMALMAVPIYVMYEVGLFCAWLAKPEAGNYMFLKSLWRLMKLPVTAPRSLYRKIKWW